MIEDDVRLFRPARTWLVLARLGLLAAVAVTLYFAFAPPGDSPPILPWDKAEHFLAFYVLAGLAAAAFPRARIAGLVAALLVLGAAIELVQATPWVHRDADARDWIADGCGVAFALAPLLLARWRREARQV